MATVRTDNALQETPKISQSSQVINVMLIARIVTISCRNQHVIFTIKNDPTQILRIIETSAMEPHRWEYRNKQNKIKQSYHIRNCDSKTITTKVLNDLYGPYHVFKAGVPSQYHLAGQQCRNPRGIISTILLLLFWGWTSIVCRNKKDHHSMSIYWIAHRKCIIHYKFIDNCLLSA